MKVRVSRSAKIRAKLEAIEAISCSTYSMERSTKSTLKCYGTYSSEMQGRVGDMACYYGVACMALACLLA